jgi:hypothetical protein
MVIDTGVSRILILEFGGKIPHGMERDGTFHIQLIYFTRHVTLSKYLHQSQEDIWASFSIVQVIYIN